MTAYDTLLRAVQALHVFRGNKKPLETKTVACLLYMSGLSYRSMPSRAWHRRSGGGRGRTSLPRVDKMVNLNVPNRIDMNLPYNQDA